MLFLVVIAMRTGDVACYVSRIFAIKKYHRIFVCKNINKVQKYQERK